MNRYVRMPGIRSQDSLKNEITWFWTLSCREETDGWTDIRHTSEIQKRFLFSQKSSSKYKRRDMYTSFSTQPTSSKMTRLICKRTFPQIFPLTLFMTRLYIYRCLYLPIYVNKLFYWPINSSYILVD